MLHISKPFNKEEILLAVQECNPRKAPGPDGFNTGWIKLLWPYLSDKVLKFFRISIIMLTSLKVQTRRFWV